MNLQKIKTVGVVGAGTMGSGIAQVCAMAGYSTLVFDVNADLLQKALKDIEQNLSVGVEKGKITQDQKQATLASVSIAKSLSDLKVDLIVEAVVERLDIKQQIFSELEKINTEETILSTNTSSIPVTQIARTLTNPSRCVGLHFFNPAHIMRLVEVIAGAKTSLEVIELMKNFALSIKKDPVVAKDSPGFIVNRVARHYYVEALQILEEQVAGLEDIDLLLQSSGFKMGPFRLMDLIGVDTNYSVTSSMYNAFHQNPKFRPSRIQEQKVNAGELGRKSGKGFYDYSS